MQRIPEDKKFDSTLDLLRDGYIFISRRCDRHKSDIFMTRLLMNKTVCLRGREAARLFYDEDKFMRVDAMPMRIKKVLFGLGGVQGLDDEEHRHRKAMFMAVMTPESINSLVQKTVAQWQIYIRKWSVMDSVVLFDELNELLCRSVCAWAGVLLKESEIEQRTRDLVAMIETPGTFMLRHMRGRLSRWRAERWAAELVRRVRNGILEVPETSVLYCIAWHRDLQGDLLSYHAAAVELLNILRPTVAVSRYAVFCALALHNYPTCREAVYASEEKYIQMFVQEVRRFYPFFPFVAARVRYTCGWRNYELPQGVRVLLDLYGTNHDSTYWKDPEVFRPERFRGKEEDRYAFIPQGGDDHYLNHRCAGEWITTEIMKSMTECLTQRMDYSVPPQNLDVDLSRIPALPESGFVISDVTAKSYS